MSAFLERLFSLHGKTALVTGASSGIGQALAVALAEAGAVVAANGRNITALQETIHLIDDAGGKGYALPADLSDVENCRALVRDAARVLSGLDIVVNCAGTNSRSPLETATPEEYELITAANLRAPYFLCQAAFPQLKKRGGGKILNIGSVTCSMGLGGVSVYGATKAALAQLTKTQAVEWAKDNIQANCLAPGFMLTPLTEESIWSNPLRSQWLHARIPAGRPGKVDDLIGAALFLLSSSSSYVTGQMLTVDGGFLAGGWWDADA